MRTVTPEPFTLYLYDELPTDEAKERARDWYREDPMGLYGWYDDDMASLEAFAKEAGFEVIDCELGPSWDRLHAHLLDTGYDDARLLVDEDDDDIYRVTGEWWEGFCERLEACELTGYWADGCFAPAIRKVLHPGTTATFRETMYQAVQDFRDFVGREVESQYEDDVVAESIRCNEYEFTVDGRIS